MPENLALGVSLVEGASLSLLVAIFASNFSESLVGAVAMRGEERSARTVMSTWIVCAIALALSVVAGRALAGGLDDSVLAVALGFAGGAVLASLPTRSCRRPSSTAARSTPSRPQPASSGRSLLAA